MNRQSGKGDWVFGALLGIFVAAGLALAAALLVEPVLRAFAGGN